MGQANFAEKRCSLPLSISTASARPSACRNAVSNDSASRWRNPEALPSDAHTDYVQSLAQFVRSRPAQPVDAFLRQTDAVVTGTGAVDCSDFAPDQPATGYEGWVFQAPADDRWGYLTSGGYGYNMNLGQVDFSNWPQVKMVVMRLVNFPSTSRTVVLTDAARILPARTATEQKRPNAINSSPAENLSTRILRVETDR